MIGKLGVKVFDSWERYTNCLCLFVRGEVGVKRVGRGVPGIYRYR